jgi:HAD superfamily hydrolase (TIGR01549 family)
VIKAIFFDWFNTLARYDPPREELQGQALRELSKGLHFVLFEDVLPILKELKKQKLILGLLTNLDIDMTPLCRELGLEPYLDFVVTSGEVDSDKPNAPIFLKALERARVKAAEAIHIGDQYKVDVTGARGVGITPLLLDRYDLSPEVNDCPRLPAQIQQISALS